MLPVNSYISHFTKTWEESKSCYPHFCNSYSTNEQELREQNYEVFQKKLQAFQSRKNIRDIKNGDPGKAFFPLFKSFLKDVFNFDSEHLEIILSDEFKDVSREFYYKARAFGPELSPENIYQAIRNVWIMNGLQLMMNLPVEITPSIFGYSMIYPYSDNFLDDPTISVEEKKDFSRRFNQRLHGKSIAAQNHTELQLYKLVEMLEEQYPRADYPSVYESLYAIQRGQTNSLKLMRPNGINDSGIKTICFEKGGASVLADGYLVAGKLSGEQEQALFGYGIYLQLLDDIQDVKEDREAHTHTIFSCANKINLDEYVNRTIHFGRVAMEEMRCFNNSKTDQFLELMNRSIETMIIESVGLNHIHYSENWLSKVEQQSPLRFEFIRNKKSESKSQRLALFQKYFNRHQPEAVGF